MDTQFSEIVELPDLNMGVTGQEKRLETSVLEQKSEREKARHFFTRVSYQSQSSIIEPQPNGEIISTMEPVCISKADSHFLFLNR